MFHQSNYSCYCLDLHLHHQCWQGHHDKLGLQLKHKVLSNPMGVANPSSLQTLSYHLKDL